MEEDKRLGRVISPYFFTYFYITKKLQFCKILRNGLISRGIGDKYF